ncbi:transglutaminase family protein [Cyanobium sp. Morenito 9A2]|uniref:transglutaminase family protein n=1 Tax=Cyanobium sp. Morenito 9A2 TaxID=2823718 RepID=UPI0020CBB3C5|nr:transglutaminase family protein [Cyanobium sp. Morenito 9A2]MCP9850701.1 transglutaminase family protein [Cyanobium sp. Morenito 9A2]
MLFQIRHALRYVYDRPVFLEPMTVRLTPQQNGHQRLLQHHLRVMAEPAGLSRIVEPDGTDALVVWFDRERAELEIEMESVVETLLENPFGWIETHGAAQKLPVAYPIEAADSLAPTMGAATSGSVRVWAETLAEAADRSTTAFLVRLADEIHAGFHHVGRLDGDPMTAEQTLQTRSGACRDTATLFVEACRSQGLAARFVSGYSMHHPPEVSEHELHAWAEVYLPGGGWRGYDPSLGLAVADGHVALAAAPDHRLAAPVTGTYRGTGVGSQMTYSVSVKATEAEPELEWTP